MGFAVCTINFTWSRIPSPVRDRALYMSVDKSLAFFYGRGDHGFDRREVQGGKKGLAEK